MYKKLFSILILAMQLNTLASSLQGSFLSSYLPPSNLSSSLPAFSKENRVFILGGLVATLTLTNGYLLYRSYKTEQENELEKSTSLK